MSRLARMGYPLVTLVAIVLVWQGYVSFFKVPAVYSAHARSGLRLSLAYPSSAGPSGATPASR